MTPAAYRRLATQAARPIKLDDSVTAQAAVFLFGGPGRPSGAFTAGRALQRSCFAIAKGDTLTPLINHHCELSQNLCVIPVLLVSVPEPQPILR